MALLREGLAVVTGYFSGTAELGGRRVTAVGDQDGFIAAYDAQGRGVWVNTSPLSGYRVHADQRSGLLFLGPGGEGLSLARLDSEGTVLDAVSLPSGLPQALVLTDNGAFYASGTSEQDELRFPAAGGDSIVLQGWGVNDEGKHYATPWFARFGPDLLAEWAFVPLDPDRGDTSVPVAALCDGTVVAARTRYTAAGMAVCDVLQEISGISADASGRLYVTDRFWDTITIAGRTLRAGDGGAVYLAAYGP